MVDPESFREVSIVISEFKDNVRGQLGDLKWYFRWVLGLLVISVGGGIAILKEVSDVETQMQKQGGEIRTEIQKQGGEVRTEIQKQFGDLRTDTQKQLGDLKTDLALVNQTLGRVDKSVADVVTAQNQTQTTLARVETLLLARSGTIERPPVVPLTFDDSEEQLIRKFISTKAVPGAKPTVKVNDVVSDLTVLKPIPDDLVAATPKLKGARFYIDEKSGSIIIVAAGDNRVAAVVAAT